ncbi:monooxygenase 2-like isoform X1 [Rosa rugosa]|uniref:monooxygenase 2-like isoform X1 n=1 Tax=Rosa rugosa TaxID=74645 RepID=UPI002B406365|nr:monooxygenase 2-like isoform X1 [Rosa rugosa]
METMVEDVVIVGAGIAGLATAVALKRAGIEALVLERSEGLRATGAALTLYPNAWSALDALGISQKLATRYAPTLKGHIIDVDTGEVQEVSRAITNEVSVGPRCLHRKALLEALADELPIHSVRFSSKITAIDTQQHEGSSLAIVHMENGNIIKAKVLIGCDGVHSVVSRWLGLGEPVLSGRSAVRGLAVFPQGHGLGQNFRQYVGTSIRAGFIPVSDKDVYWFFSCISPAKGVSLGEDPEETKKQVLENYAKDLPPLYLDVVQHSDLSTLTWAPLKFRYPWHVVFGNLSKQNITVAGDAMHPMTPDLAQGGGSALEDAVVLGRHIGKSFVKNGRVLVPKEMVVAIDKYVEERRWHVALLVAGSYISGWVQQAGSAGWGKKFLRDVMFYKFLYPKIVRYMHYDCGKLDF